MELHTKTYQERLKEVTNHSNDNPNGNFEKAEELNRHLFRIMAKDLFVNTGDFLWSWLFCPANAHLPFDVVVCSHSRLTGRVTQTLLIEMKVRNVYIGFALDSTEAFKML